MVQTNSTTFLPSISFWAVWDCCHRCCHRCQSLQLTGFSFHPRESLPLAGGCKSLQLPVATSDRQSLQLTGFSFHPRDSLPLTGGGHDSFLYHDCFFVGPFQSSPFQSSPFQSSPLRDQSLLLAFQYECLAMAKGRDDNYATLSTERMRIRSCIQLRN